VSPLEVRMAHLEGAFEQTTQRLAGFELRFDALDRKVESLRSDLNAKIHALASKTDRHFMWTIGLIFGTWATAIGAIVAALTHH